MKSEIQDIAFSVNGSSMNTPPWNLTTSLNWSSLDITVLNLNTKDSQVQGVGIVSPDGVRFALNYSTPDGEIFNASHWLTIPATEAVTIHLDPLFNLSSPVFISQGDPVTVRIVTSYYNIFEKTFMPPAAVIKWHTETEDLTVATRHVLILDGSDSTSDGTITSWNWKLADGANTIPAGNWNDTTNATIHLYSGSMPRVICPSAGPFNVTLTVTDDSGMTATSLPVQVPADSLFDPPVNLNVDVSGLPGCQAIVATVSDINGIGVENVPVSFIRTSGTLLSIPTR